MNHYHVTIFCQMMAEFHYKSTEDSNNLNVTMWLPKVIETTFAKNTCVTSWYKLQYRAISLSRYIYYFRGVVVQNLYMKGPHKIP